MRKAALALLALVTLTPAAPAQPWANKLFAEHAHNFGTVARGAQLVHRFPLTNIYAVPLEITQVRVSCGCVTAKASKRVLQPRETCTIDIAMDARRFSGDKSVTVHVTVGPKYVSTAELKISAHSRADVVFNPGQVQFGAVARGQTPSRTIDVEYAGRLDWRVTEVLAPDAPFDVELKELYRRPGQQVGYQVKVTLKPEVPAGALRREIHLRTNDPASPLIPVLVEADVQASLRVSPAVLRFGTVKPGEAAERKVRVQGQKPFRVLGVEGLGDGLDLGADLPTNPAPVQTVTLKVRSDRPGDLNRQVRIKTDLGDVTVSIDGTVAP